MTYYFDMDGVLSNFHAEPYKYANAINRNWISSLKPFVENVNLIKRLIAKGDKVYILSKAASEAAKLGKYDWLHKYIPEIDRKDIIVIVGNGRKVDYIREIGILIDDDIKNIRQWAKEGYPTYLLQEKGEAVKL